MEGDELAAGAAGRQTAGGAGGAGAAPSARRQPPPRDGEDPDGSDKYKKKAPLYVQLITRFAPEWTGAIPNAMLKRGDSLDAMESGSGGGRGGGGKNGESAAGGAIKRRRKSRTDPRTVIVALSLLSCLATMVLLYTRLAPLDLPAQP